MTTKMLLIKGMYYLPLTAIPLVFPSWDFLTADGSAIEVSMTLLLSFQALSGAIRLLAIRFATDTICAIQSNIILVQLYAETTDPTTALKGDQRLWRLKREHPSMHRSLSICFWFLICDCNTPNSSRKLVSGFSMTSFHDRLCCAQTAWSLVPSYRKRS